MGEKIVTSWQPDTCGCIIEYSWDRDSDENNRVHSFHGHSRKCSDHEHLWNEDVYTTVLEENQRKNIAIQHTAEQTHLGTTVTVDKGRRTQRVLRQDVGHNFFFTHQGEPIETGPNKPRVLHLTFSEPLENNHRNIIELRFPGLIQVH